MSSAGSFGNVSLEKQKAILILYCLIQFRNKKAQLFNVLYLVAAIVMWNKYKGNPEFEFVLKQFVDVLRMNSSAKPPSDDSFFNFEVKPSIFSKGTLYERAFHHCRKAYPGIVTEKIIVRSQNGARQFVFPSPSEISRDTPVANSILRLFEPDKIAQAASTSVETIGEEADGEGLAAVYKCAAALQSNSHKEVFSIVKEFLLGRENSETDCELKVFIGSACIVLAGLSMIEGSAVNMKELPTFLNEFLINPRGIVDFHRKLGIAEAGKVITKSIPLGIGLMSKTPLTDLIVPRLLKNPNSALYGYFIAGQSDTVQLLMAIKEETKRLVKQVLRDDTRSDNILGATIILSNNNSKVAVASTVVRDLNKYMEILLKEASVKDIKLYKRLIRWKPIGKNSREFIKQLATRFESQFTSSSFNKIFISKTKTQLLSQVFKELMSVIAIFKKTGLIKVDPCKFPSKEWISGSADAEQLAKDVFQSYKLIWQLIIFLMMIEICSGIKPREVMHIKLAALLFRVLALSKEHLAFGKSLVKSFDYNSLNPTLPLHTELMEDLARTVHLYTDKDTQTEIIGAVTF